MNFLDKLASTPYSPALMNEGYQALDAAVAENQRLQDSITTVSFVTLRHKKGSRTMTSTSTKPLGNYTSYTPGDEGILADLQERYGAQLQGISRIGKLIFRAALANYLVLKPIWNDEGNCISCVDGSIASAGGDDHDIWSNDPEFVEYIRACCGQLSESDIEGLIEALTSHLRYG